MVSAITFLRTVRALQKAGVIKRELPYCVSMREKGVCNCKSGELCQTALARALNVSDETIRKLLLMFERLDPNENPFEIRVITDIKQSYPRKFIKLKEIIP